MFWQQKEKLEWHARGFDSTNTDTHTQKLKSKTRIKRASFFVCEVFVWETSPWDMHWMSFFSIYFSIIFYMHTFFFSTIWCRSHGSFSSFFHSIDTKMVHLVHYNRVQSLIISVLLLLFFIHKHTNQTSNKQKALSHLFLCRSKVKK